MSSINDLIQAAVSGEPVAASDAFSDLMSGRIAGKIDAMVPEVSAAMFSPASEE
jgi:hypothetical protein